MKLGVIGYGTIATLALDCVARQLAAPLDAVVCLAKDGGVDRAAAMLDQAWHTIGVAQAPAAKDVASFEADALKKAGIDYGPVPTRYHSTYFSHIFSGGYAASYYAYLWSEVLARDTGAWLLAHGGLTRANGDRLRAKVLSRGRTEDPEKLFEDFYGRGPDIGPLLEYRGLAEATH